MTVPDAFMDLSPTALVQLRATQSPTTIARAKFRGQTRRQIRTCTDCLLHRDQPEGCGPVPFASPPSPMFTVIGEAPGPEESRRGVPFVGPSGKLLKALMSDVDIDADEDVLFANTVSCFPNVDGKVRPPVLTESEFCRDNMLDQIECSYTKYVLLVGAKALGAFRGDLAVTNHHGRVFVWLETYVVMGIVHPAAALRGQRHFKGIIREDLAKWRDVVYGGDDPLKWLTLECVRCGDTEGARWDRDGVPYCKRHWDQWKGQWEKERRKWNVRIEQLSF